MKTQIKCESCGSSAVELNPSGIFVCLHCGTQYVESFSGSICIKKQLSEEENCFYVKRLAIKLSEEINTPVDIFDLKIIEKFKLVANNIDEINIKYSYKNIEYLAIFDDLGIKKITFPKNKTISIAKQKNDKKFLICFLVMIVLMGVLGVFIDLGIVSLLYVVIILSLLGKTLAANNKIVEEERKIKQKQMLNFLNKNNLDTSEFEHK